MSLPATWSENPGFAVLASEALFLRTDWVGRRYDNNGPDSQDCEETIWNVCMWQLPSWVC